MLIHFGAEISLKDETMGGSRPTEKYLRRNHQGTLGDAHLSGRDYVLRLLHLPKESRIIVSLFRDGRDTASKSTSGKVARQRLVDRQKKIL